MKLAAALAAVLALVSASSADSWKPLARLPQLLAGPIAVTLDGKLFVISGNTMNGVPTAAVSAFDLKRRTWERRADAPKPLGGAAVAVLDGLIYVAGGCTRSDCGYPTNAVNAYDTRADRWSSLPPLPLPMWAAVGAALGGRFYVFGGVEGSLQSHGASALAYVYDPSARSWSRLHDLPTPLANAAGAVFGGRFVLLGGCVTPTAGRKCDVVTTAAYEYDPAADAWSAFTPLPARLAYHGAVGDGDKLIVAGGRPDEISSWTGKTYVYVRGAKRWVEGSGFLRARMSVSLFNLPVGIGAFGTTQREKAGLTNPYVDDIVESLGAPGPFLDPGAAAPLPPAIAEKIPVRVPRAPSYLPEELPLPVAPNPHAHAVVIGIERYRETLPRADFAGSDAKLAAEYFKRVLGVPEENLVLLIDDRATKSDFEKYFERWLANRVEKGDEVFVYFSGHGAPNPKSGESYLVPFDADPTYIEQTGYPIKRLYSQLAKLPAKRVLVAMDSCFSGAGGRSVIAKGARPLVSVLRSDVPPPLTVITASGGDQISNSYQEKRHGLFTYFFLQGLKEKHGDLRATYEYLKPQVSRVARREYNSEQDPQWRGGK